MDTTKEIREQLRRKIDEVIPAGKTDADTRFLDTELDEILTPASSIEAAAADCWLLKATRAFSERGGVESNTVGSETVKFASLEKYRDHCLSMAAIYKSEAPAGTGGGSGSLMFGYALPDISGVSE